MADKSKRIFPLWNTELAQWVRCLLPRQKTWVWFWSLDGGKSWFLHVVLRSPHTRHDINTTHTQNVKMFLKNYVSFVSYHPKTAIYSLCENNFIWKLLARKGILWLHYWALFSFITKIHFEEYMFISINSNILQHLFLFFLLQSLKILLLCSFFQWGSLFI